MSLKRRSYEAGHKPKFLVVIDETPECDRAVYYASRREARTNAKLVMVAVASPPGGNQEWLGVSELMRTEALEEAEGRLDEFAARARNLAGIDPQRVV